MEEIVFYQWNDVGEWVSDVQNEVEGLHAKGWKLADKIRDGIDQFGKGDRNKVSDLYDSLAEHTGLARKTLWNMSVIAKKFPPGKRNLNLTISHHVALLGIQNDDQIDYYMSVAEANGMSANRLRALAHLTPVERNEGNGGYTSTKVASEEYQGYQWRFEMGMLAHCKYCYETHDDWAPTFDNAWICGKCDHAIHDSRMDIREAEDLPFTDKYEEEDPPYNENYMYELPTIPELTKPHVAHNSGNNEWYTPAEYIAAAREVLEEINLDPASSAAANQVVGANDYYTAEDNGLVQEWIGKVWMNPPYESALIGLFVDKLCHHYESGSVTEAIVLVNNATETRWFQTLARHATGFCFPRSRIRYWGPDGREGDPLQGQAILYLGVGYMKFASVFRDFGLVVKHV